MKATGITAEPYHKSLSDEKRDYIQKQWMDETVLVVVATIAFGLGIDKQNVRFVIHWDPPNGLQAYIQEAGRAGRDQQPARCILYHDDIVK